VKLVQMPTDLLHLEDADLDVADVDPRLLTAFRSYLPRALEERRGLAILVPATAGAHRMLVVLARRVGVALRDGNIRLRDSGGDLQAGRKKLCYLPGGVLGSALATPGARAELAREAACFFQDLEGAWSAGTAGSEPLSPDALLDLLDERLAAGRPTFLNAAPDRLPPGLEDGLRARLPILDPLSC
jgi:hypothetical protein